MSCIPGNGKPETLCVFSKESFSYISGNGNRNGNSKKTSDISGGNLQSQKNKHKTLL